MYNVALSPNRFHGYVHNKSLALLPKWYVTSTVRIPSSVRLLRSYIYVRSFHQTFPQSQPTERDVTDTVDDAMPPRHTDLLELYHSLVTLRKIEYDEAQIRVVMQLRRLQKELSNYVPRLVSSYPHPSHRTRKAPVSITQSTSSDHDGGFTDAWWSHSLHESGDEQTREIKALVRRKNYAEELASLETPKGLLLTGSPGSGKSFLIDLWFSTLPTPFKARKHYDQLVLELYRAVWEETKRRMILAGTTEEDPGSRILPADSIAGKAPWSKSIRERWRGLASSGLLPSVWSRSANYLSSSSSLRSQEPSIGFIVAKRLLLSHWLLVFDELQLLDISSAGLLADVLSWYWRMGGVIVGTSNAIPEDLYKNGVQKERLEPFVEALKVRCPLLVMESEKDWRKVKGMSKEKRTWYTTDRETLFTEKLKELVTVESHPQTRGLSVFGRRLHVPWSSGGVCKYDFAELCNSQLGHADYLTLASTYHTVVVTSVPVLKLSAKDQARRFISLIDALYEARCRLVCLADADPEDMFFSNESGTTMDVDVMLAESVGEVQGTTRPNVSSYSAPNMLEAREAKSALDLDSLTIFSGKDEQFAYKRALSRLLEMTSETYQRDEIWTPLPSKSRQWEESLVKGRSTALRSRLAISTEFDTEVKYQPENEASDDHIYPAVDRPVAPQINQNHVWGVRDDWGKGAKTWGQGAKP